MSRQRKRHPNAVNAGKMYTSERKASFKVRCFSNKKDGVRCPDQLVGLQEYCIGAHLSVGFVLIIRKQSITS